MILENPSDELSYDLKKFLAQEKSRRKRDEMLTFFSKSDATG
jgi:hypothetical protein